MPKHPSVIHDVSQGNMSQAEKEFLEFLDPSAVISDEGHCFSRSSTQWTSAKPDQKPALVLLPSSTKDVSSIMRICSKRRIPVTGYAGGTNLPGALVSTRGGVCVDFKRMNNVISIHKDDMDAVVQPAVGWKELNDHLASEDLFFPPDPSPDAKIGGMIAMSCSGTNAYRYGTMKEWVIALTVVLADGSVVKTRRRPRKSSAGYDLTRLMIGSEGTLGLVTEAVLKLASAPTNLHVAVVTFPDVQAAVRTGLRLTGSGLLIEALELLDAESMKAINMAKVSYISWQELPTLFLKFAGSRDMVKDQIEIATKAAQWNHCTKFEVTDEQALVDAWWDARKAVGKALLARKRDPSDVFLPSDAAVPISRLADLMVESQRMLADAKMVGSVVGHLGDGNIHVVIVCPQSEKAKGADIIAEVQKLAIEMEGTITGEHGIGLSLRDMLVEELGNDTIDLMRRIKLALDPLCILNCDKVVRLDI